MASKKKSTHSASSAQSTKSVESPAVTTEKAAAKAAVVPAVTPAATPVAAPVAAVVAAPVTAVAATPAAVAAPTIVAPKVDVAAGRDRTSIIALIAKLSDNDAEVARDAAVTIGTLPADAQAVDALCSVLSNADGFFHSVVRAAAATALGKLGDKRAIDSLIAATGDNMAEASEEAVKALGLLGDKRAAAALQAIIANAQGFYLEGVRRTATEALKQLKA